MKAALTILLMLSVIACTDEPVPAPAAEPADYSQRMAREHAEDRPVASPAARTAADPGVHSQDIIYGSSQGHDLTGYLAYPAAAEGGLPAVLVFHEWWGLNDNIRAMAEQLAGEGYVALAPDLYAGRVAENRDEALALMNGALGDPRAISRNIAQAHAFLRSEIKATSVGSIGWCLGGTMSLNAGIQLGDQVDAVVIYYGHVDEDPTRLGKLRAPVLGLFGDADEGIPLASVRAFETTLQSMGKPLELKIYEGVGHAFANPTGTSYRAAAAEDAWRRSLEFLARHLKDG